MAFDESLRSITLDADATIGIYTGVPGARGSADPNNGKQYCFVTVTGRHQAGLATAAGDSIGVLQNKPQSTGEAATVGYHGVSLVQAGGTLNPGDGVQVGTGGTGVILAAGVKVGTVIIGAASGQLATVLLRMN